MSALRTLLRLLRAKHWTKNAVVLAAFVFAYGDQQQSLTLFTAWKAILAAVAFSLLSSAVYIFNDLRDAPQDRLHPIKCRRPIAAGTVQPLPAAALALGLLVAALWGAWRIEPALLLVLGSYLLLQVVYTLGLKRVPLVDVLVISVGFVLRALAGGVAIRVPISPWLLVCTMMLALFLALCKRRHEKVNLAGRGTRDALDGYDERLLDLLITMTGTAALVCYALYTLWPETVHKFGTPWLAATIPFVVFGLFRYMDLVYRQEKGDRPEQLLLTDWPLMLDVALYGLAVLGVLALR
ncbi:MAG TPA: decaprenyl-phosphate phosphoribosyltransferase [Kiritimatiellia bacterium]|jgi:4-hydroxybenzoate polyprenyltransferase|nr:decaprenyl-phosphate phosphoribosyltransferase [Kiritimatiellia bacterium]MBP9572434.1 decaprenyl-phosphate phosphoribosyltransferase [Kiritimatiellia bacterium]HQF21437.1 decaprenyl-phosphate phosphoribosyltransferase [Kiritimatiellia bacterium]HXK79676.1 decaprenyl-phosphate phosphoribosyltransferase [Kiritimatiellia bacterium]